MAARSPHPKCPVCRRKHDPRFTTTGIHGVGKMAFHNRVLHRCSYQKGANFDQLLAEQAERQRQNAELDEIDEAIRQFKGNPAALIAWIEARARTNVNHERKLDALRRLAEHPSTPPNEAQAARAAIERLKNKK
jgi:hypothetical protein